MKAPGYETGMELWSQIFGVLEHERPLRRTNKPLWRANFPFDLEPISADLISAVSNVNKREKISL